MAKPYSMDLRERVAAAIMAGQGPEAVARRFEISLSSVGRHIRRFRETGTLAPDKFGGYKRHGLAGGVRACRQRPFIHMLETEYVYFLHTFGAVLSTFVTHPCHLVR